MQSRKQHIADAVVAAVYEDIYCIEALYPSGEWSVVSSHQGCGDAMAAFFEAAERVPMHMRLVHVATSQTVAIANVG